MVTSDIRALNFDHYLAQKEKKLHTKIPSFEEQMETYKSLGPVHQQLAREPVKEIIELEEKIRLLQPQLRELKKKYRFR